MEGQKNDDTLCWWSKKWMIDCHLWWIRQWQVNNFGLNIRWREIKFTFMGSSWCDIYVPSTRGQINEETKDSWLTMLMEQKVNN